MPGAPTPSNKTALQSFVDQSVSASLTKYLEGKEDPGREYFVCYFDRYKKEFLVIKEKKSFTL